MSWRSLAMLYVLYIRACEYARAASNQDVTLLRKLKNPLPPPPLMFHSELIFLGVYIRRKNVPWLIFVVCCF